MGEQDGAFLHYQAALRHPIMASWRMGHLDVSSSEFVNCKERIKKLSTGSKKDSVQYKI